MDLDVGNAECGLIDDDCRSSAGVVGERDLPRTFSSAPIFNKMINEDVAQKRDDECDDEMLGRVIAFHLNGGFADGAIK